MQTETLKHVTGDISKPLPYGRYKIIALPVDDCKTWTSDVLFSIEDMYPDVKELYLRHTSITGNLLGEVQLIQVEPTLFVANLFSQRGLKNSTNNSQPIRYEALDKCLKTLSKKCLNFFKDEDVAVHLPKFDTDITGGDWSVIEHLIISNLCDKGIKTVVYNHVK